MEGGTPPWAGYVMLCASCSAENPEDFLYCGRCGKSLFRPDSAVDQRSLSEHEVFQYLVESTPDGYFIMVDGVFPYMNAALPRMFGYGADEAFRITVTQVIHPQDWERMQRNVMANIQGTFQQAVEYLGVRKGGSTFPVEVLTAPIFYREKHGVHGIIRDVTARKMLEDQVLRMERVGVLARLASGIAHEFNNLLAIIHANAEVVLALPGLPFGVEDSLQRIQGASVRGAEKVRYIQELSHLRTDDFEFAPVDIDALLLEVIDLTRSRWKDEAERIGVHFEVAFEPGRVGKVPGSVHDLKSVFMSMVFNALEAMPRGGRVEVSTASRDGGVEVRIRDHGVGMNPDVRDRIFDPFFSTKNDHGMGLGLGLAFGVVKRHRGTIEVESTVGQGSLFVVRLPAPDSPHLTQTQEATLTDPTSPDVLARVLVIDDQVDLLQVVGSFLSSRGHRVEMADGGRAGVEKIQGETFDVVITDLGMPDMSGWEVADAINRLSPGVPVVLMTGWASEIDESRLRAHRIQHLLPKPFRKEQLLRAVQRVLRTVDPSLP